MSDRVAPSRLRSSICVAIGLLLPFVIGCGAKPFDATRETRLDPSFYRERFTIGRLAGQTDWHPCEHRDSLVCSAAVRTKKEFDRLASKSQSAQQRLETDSSSGALRDAGLLALRLRDSTSNGLTNAVRLLDAARRSPPADPRILNDFAVAQLELGERQDARQKDIRPYLRALDAIQRSLIADSLSAAALFNRALILERLNFLASAQRAWARYQTIEPDTLWQREARSHQSRIARLVNARPLMQGGRDQAFRLLGEWGRAVANHDEARSAEMLDRVRRISASADTLYADHSVRLTLNVLDSLRRLADRTGNQKPLERLAAAHIDLSDGSAVYSSAAEFAAERLGRAERELRALGSAAAGWAAYYRASAELNGSAFDVADARLKQLTTEASEELPALRGKAIQTRGVIEVRRGNFESANRLYRAAAPYLAEAKEDDNVGGIAYLLSESLSSAGQYAAGREEAYQGLRLLAPFRRSSYLHFQLSTIAVYARADSLPYAALAVMDEALGVARERDDPDALALDYRTRALDLLAVDRRDSARAALAIGMALTDKLSGNVQARRRADLQLVEGQILRADDPRAALPLLDSAAKEYRRRTVLSKTTAALYQTAMAAQGAGDTARARALLGEAIAQIERQESTFESSEGRAALFETADNAFDAMIDLEMRAGHPDVAFEYLERERAAAKLASIDLQAGGRPAQPPSLTSISRYLSADMLFVEYALLRDRAILWTASRRGVTQHTIQVPRDTVAALVERYFRESSIPTAREGDARSRLHTLLLGQLRNELQGVRQIVLVCDRELARLPFSGLWDEGAQRYVVEAYRIRTVPSAAFFVAARKVASARERRPTALVVGDPMLDTALRLSPLPGARLEAEHVAKLYPNATRLTGPEARRDTILTLLHIPQVFHFAGHAVFNSDRPELSYLAFGAGRGDNGPGTLEAREIAKLRLSNLRLVVLSACQTLSSRTSRTGAVAGLASSFLRAGAPAIISTLWDVDDAVTGPLLTAFHSRYAAGNDADEALQLAQMEILRARPGQRAAPATWAPFIYAGP